MGFVLSKFRKKPSSKESLEKIEKELRDINRFQIDTEIQQKRIIGRLLIFSSVMYLLSAAVFYFLAPRGLKWSEQLKHVLPFVIFPILMWLIKRGISWYYENKIVNNRQMYNGLKKEKEKLLEDVMDNETFKVAKEILEKYAPAHLLPKYLAEQQKAVSMSPMPATPNYISTPQSRIFQEGIRRRQLNMNMGRASTPLGIQQPNMPRTPIMRALPGSNQGQLFRQPANPFIRAIMPSSPTIGATGRPISPRLETGRQATAQYAFAPPSYMFPLPPVNPIVQNRGMGWLDKIVDFVVGDGASHRFALICRYCATHNGLATPEDFPYTGFRCVFCRQFNPPRQVRPAAPRLPINTVLIEELEQGSTLKDETGSTFSLEESSSNLLKGKESLEVSDYEIKSESSRKASQDILDELNILFESKEDENQFENDQNENQHENNQNESEQERVSCFCRIKNEIETESENPLEIELTEDAEGNGSPSEFANKQNDEYQSGFVMIDKLVTSTE